MAAFTDEMEEENKYRELEKIAVKVENQAAVSTNKPTILDPVVVGAPINNIQDSSGKSENSKNLLDQLK